MEVCENIQLMAKGEKPGGSVGYQCMCLNTCTHPGELREWHSKAKYLSDSDGRYKSAYLNSTKLGSLVGTDL